MASFNKVILIGNLTADPELKQTAQGTSVCSFTLAVNRRYSRQDQGQNTDFINIKGNFGSVSFNNLHFFHYSLFLILY